LLLLILLILSFNFSCRKEYIQPPATIDSIPQSKFGEVQQKFFNTHLPSDENIIAIRNNILRQEIRKPFVDRFVKFAGYPVWEKTVTKIAGFKTNTSAREAASNSKIIFIPLALDSQQRVNAIMQVKIAGNDTAFHVLYKWQYNVNGYSENAKFNSANQTALLFMGLESYTFGHKDFKINDTLLLKGTRASDTIHIKSFNSNTSERAMLMELVTVTICYDIVMPNPIWVRLNVVPCNCHTEEHCDNYNIWVDGGKGGSGGGGGGSAGGGGTSGGGDDGGDDGGWQDDPCAPPSGNPNIPPMRIGQLAPCDEGGSGSGGGDPWLPVLPADDPIVPPTQEQINTTIKNEPFALFHDVPCETVKKWLAIATFQPPDAIINKLNTVYNTITIPGTAYDQPAMTFQDVARVQDINDAFSSVVNMDYFSVKVNTLPVVNGTRLTADQFLHYIRTNINIFVDNNISKFTPYKYGSTDDAALWNSSSPTGAIVSIAIPGSPNSTFTNYGSVVTSFSTNNKWTFTTIHDPLNGEHPVSGNRDFGYTTNSDGSYTFYTEGVDRLTDWETALLNVWPLNIPFKNADNLWESFQAGIYNFLNTHSGSSIIQTPQIHRPDWQTVMDVIVGKKPLSTLSKLCP
jgi:hypothetical protein